MKTSILAFALVCAAASASSQTLERFNPTGIAQPQTYMQVIRAGKLVFISGQVGIDEAGKLVGPGMIEQLQRVLANLAAALKSQGADFSHVAKVTIYTTSIAELRAPEAMALRQKYFGDNRPTSTLVQIQQLANPDFKVEIEAIAVLP